MNPWSLLFGRQMLKHTQPNILPEWNRCGDRSYKVCLREGCGRCGRCGRILPLDVHFPFMDHGKTFGNYETTGLCVELFV